MAKLILPIKGSPHRHPRTSGCWIDALRLSSLHDHHVIPRAYGGSDGPRVMICNSCHEAIHDAAEKNLTAEQYSIQKAAKKCWNKPEDLYRANHLIKIIQEAKQMASKSSNKTVLISVRLSAKENQILSDFAKLNGLSKKNALKQLIIAQTQRRRGKTMS